MSGWIKAQIKGLPVYQAKTMSWLPGIQQGFTTRCGGISSAPFDSLNLGDHVGDDPCCVSANRDTLFSCICADRERVAFAKQVHGSQVGVVTSRNVDTVPEVDALVTNESNITLAMCFADCVPIYLVDPVRRVIGLVHSGWRGCSDDVVGKAVACMTENFQTDPRQCVAAVGPCIGVGHYEVRLDVADRFRNYPAGKYLGASTAVIPKSEMQGTYSLNLRQIVFTQLMASGLRADSIAVSHHDTYSDKRDFYSYRRDGVTSGRMAAYISMAEPRISLR